jgi:ankyrin repeat protein
MTTTLDPNKLAAGSRHHFPHGKMTPLMRFAESGAADKVADLVDEHKADVTIANEFGLTALHFASSSAVVRVLVERGADVHAKAKEFVTSEEAKTEPLELAVRRGDTGVVAELAASGADVNNCASLVEMCLFSDNRLGALSALLAAGLLVDGPGDDGSPLHKAIEQKNLAAVRILCDAGADLAIKSLRGGYPPRLKTPLAHAILIQADAIEVFLSSRDAPLK